MRFFDRMRRRGQRASEQPPAPEVEAAEAEPDREPEPEPPEDRKPVQPPFRVRKPPSRTEPEESSMGPGGPADE